MKNYIVREVPADCCDFSYYFDDDGLSERGGDFCYTLFILFSDYGRLSGLNVETYKDIQKQAEAIIDGFIDVQDGVTDYDGRRYTYKRVMEEEGVRYNSRVCHAMKEWAKDADVNDTDDIAAFLTLTTGKKWSTSSACGYCQGDYVEMVYCKEHYKNGVQHYGEVWLGAAKEFDVITLDENGEETDCCGGYIVADCQVSTWNDEDYKRLVCEWACIPEDKTEIQMIDGYTTRTEYTYRTA